jgi:hypothetical protein
MSIGQAADRLAGATDDSRQSDRVLALGGRSLKAKEWIFNSDGDTLTTIWVKRIAISWMSRANQVRCGEQNESKSSNASPLSVDFRRALYVTRP